MSKQKLYFLPILLFLVFLSTQVSAQEKVYTEGTVWDVSFISTKAPYFDDYLANLNNAWRKVMDAAKKEGLVVSYKILSSRKTSPNDWDLMLLVEYKNMAVLDNLSEKMEKIQNDIFGTEKSMKEAGVKRNEIREILGEKLTRELMFK